MTTLINKSFAVLLSITLAGAPLAAQNAEPTSDAQQPGYTFKVSSELVLVNVVVRDKSGNLVRDLKRDDFTVLEDGKPQQVLSFDIEKPDSVIAPAPQSGPEQATIQGEIPQIMTGRTLPRQAVRDRRLIVIFFDLTSMQPEEIERAVQAASDYVDKQMAPADLVSIVTLGDSMQVAQDFTANRELLKTALKRLSDTEGEGFEAGDTGDSSSGSENGAEYTVDDTEYNLFNTDRRLAAISSLAKALAGVEQKKSVLYFSGGMQKTGLENEAQLKAAVNAAVRANMALYTVDIRGLQALPPGGGADQGSLRGTSAYSGRAVQSDLDSNFASQETLTTLAADTGGKAFLDSNDFHQPFAKVQDDTSSYYVLGYRSTNKAMDGRYRRITVKLNRRDVKLEFRRGYYGPRDFKHFTNEDREKQLDDEMMAQLPSTDLPIYVDTAYFRAADDRYYVPVSMVVPGSVIPFTQNGDKDKATLDVMGAVTEASTHFPIGTMRDTVKLAVESQQAAHRNIQYTTGFMLPPGKYHLKIVARENQSGKIGSFETDFTVPDLKKLPLKMSTVVLSTQRGPVGKQKQNPLAQGNTQLIQNLSHVFSPDQQLTFYFEVYDPAKEKHVEEVAASSGGNNAHVSSANVGHQEVVKKGSIRLLTSIQFFSGKVKAYETPLLETTELSVPSRKAATFQLEVPLSKLRPGWYTCQVNVIDDAGGAFSFPRMPILIRAARANTATTAEVR
jgi:VWFA-related protein